MIILSSPEFRYFSLPEKFCPGSSLMPHKRNPCPLELLRAKAAGVQSMLLQVLEITRGLPSGYNRDFQETKRPLIQGFEVTILSLKVFARVFSDLKVHKENCIKALTSDLFATDRVLELVKQGLPFRDAYREVALHLDQVAMEDPVAHLLAKTHQGATGNLGLSGSVQRIEDSRAWSKRVQERWEDLKATLSL